jgi:hypothetical protein
MPNTESMETETLPIDLTTLDAERIRQRLDEIHAEESALRALLRVALARERASRRLPPKKEAARVR